MPGQRALAGLVASGACRSGDVIVDIVYGVVVATVLLQGTALGPVLKRLAL